MADNARTGQRTGTFSRWRTSADGPRKSCCAAMNAPLSGARTMGLRLSERRIASYPDLRAALRARREELGLRQLDIDEIAGWQFFLQMARCLTHEGKT